MRILDLSPDQRPRERLLAGQGESLADADLLALLWGTGRRGQSAVELAQGLLGLGLNDWLEQPGLGPAKAGQLWAALELTRRGHRSTERLRITSPRAAGEYLLPRHCGWTEERFGLLALNAKGDLLAERILSQGTTTATLISPGSSSGRPCATAPPRPWPSTTTPAATPPPAAKTSSRPGASSVTSASE